jgi:hypothetical protein
MALERSLDVRCGEICMRDHPVGDAGSICVGLKPSGFLHGVAASDCGLNVDDALHVLEARLSEEIVGEVAMRLDGAVVAEVRIRLGLGKQPVPAEGRI